MKILAQLCDCINGKIGQISALCKDQIPEPWSDIDYLFDSMIR